MWCHDNLCVPDLYLDFSGLRFRCLSSPGLCILKVSGYADVLLVATFVLGVLYKMDSVMLFALCPELW